MKFNKTTALSIAFVMLATNLLQAQNYRTPWWALCGLNFNSTKYTGATGSTNAPLFYVDCRAISIGKNSYGEMGLPVASYLLTRLVAKGSSAFTEKKNGEVSYSYLKIGGDIFKGKTFKIGMGGFFDFRLAYADKVGTTAIGNLGWGALGPMVYAKIYAGKLVINPIFDYHILNGGVASGDDKRPGFDLSANIIMPFTDNLAVHITPMYGYGNYKSRGIKASDVALKCSIVKSF
jgi:hypothetical protein